MEKLRVGPPLDKAIDMGAIVAPVQLERIRQLVSTGVAEGATMWQPSWACPTEGYFYPPTLFTNVAPAATIAQVEIFGPVLVAMMFRTPAEAVELANNTDRKSTRLNSSHSQISYAVFCLKKKNRSPAPLQENDESAHAWQ